MKVRSLIPKFKHELLRVYTQVKAKDKKGTKYFEIL